MAGKGKPNFLQAMAALKGKKIRGLQPTGDPPDKAQSSKAGFKKKIFGSSKNKDPKGGKKLQDVQNV